MSEYANIIAMMINCRLFWELVEHFGPTTVLADKTVSQKNTSHIAIICPMWIIAV